MADDPERGGKRRRTWLLTGTGLALLALAVTGALTLEAQVRPGLQSPHPRLLDRLPVDWDAVADDYNPERAERLSHLTGFEQNHDDFDNTSLPIIMPGPSSSISTANMTFSSVGDAYGMALPQEQLDSDVTIVITATRHAVDAERGTFDPKDFDTLNVGGRRVKAIVAPTESGWTASFSRYGAIYSIDVDCGNTGAGSPCQSADYIRRVAANLSDITLGRRGEASLPPEAYRSYAPEHSAEWNRLARYPARDPIKDWDRETRRRGSSAWGPVDNHAPRAADDQAETARNRALSIRDGVLLANDKDPDGEAPRLTGVSNPVNGTVSYSGGVVRFVPNEGFSGEARFDYAISDSRNRTDTATVYIDVAAPPPPPPPPPPKQCRNADGFPTQCSAAAPASPTTAARPNRAASDLVEK